MLPGWEDFQKGQRGKVRSSGNSRFHPALGQHLLGVVSPGTGRAVTVPLPLELAEGTGRRQGAHSLRPGEDVNVIYVHILLASPEVN